MFLWKISEVFLGKRYRYEAEFTGDFERIFSIHYPQNNGSITTGRVQYTKRGYFVNQKEESNVNLKGTEKFLDNFFEGRISCSVITLRAIETDLNLMGIL
jgi:hypothetical protein